MGVNVFMYIFQGQTPDLLDQILQALVPASLSGTLLWFSPQMLENPWNKCSDWSSSDACVRYQSLAQSQFLLGAAVFSLESWISLALSWLYCETEMNVHPILLWYVTLAKLLNLCECEDYMGDNKLQYGRKHATYVKASQFFFSISSLFWWHLGCVLPENQVGAPKLTDNVSLTAQPDDLLSVGLSHTTSPVQGCGSSLDSAPDSGASWSECLILFLTLWFPDLVHLKRQPWSSGNSPGIWIVPWLSHLLTA